MENHLDLLLEKAGNTVRHWWLIMIAGLFSMVAGIMVFSYPLESYVTLSLLFGVLMLVTGVAELAVALMSRNYFMMRGYTIVGGILDLLLGILLCCYPVVELTILPVFLGVWMLYHGFMTVGFASDLMTFKVPGAGWTFAGGILLLVLSVVILLKPFSIGVAAVVALTGVAFVALGVLMVWISLRLKNIHRHFKASNLKDAIKG
ncbi:MAG TPA: DUF308 domain-containing protein [Candidatus Coprenecus stercoripullorum]|nr:DUF308 domain-containing protein [Candidatus Coprenecus stercoripullorum]